MDFETIWTLLANTIIYGGVYTDFANTNKVRSFGLLNSKLDITQLQQMGPGCFVIGNNLTNQINYTFLFTETASMIQTQISVQ
ncbi:hypothetical protein EJ377_00425 [Chryseobacterium arthrosphaerae]|uniref:Uncharacterized protein n=1 Tax=Chryseobacterium arthrosphaerae TaxID=651561 RepID=A0A3S0QVC9_9FLAO|nr:hypothetical protein EJ377_00425 [Chryseobacterium arthrosphaerae]